MRLQSILKCLLGAWLVMASASAQAFKATTTVSSVEVSGPESANFRREVATFLENSATKELLEPLVAYSFKITNNDLRRITYYVVRYNFRDGGQKPVRAVFRNGIRGAAALDTGTSEYLFPLPDVRARTGKGVAIPSAALAGLNRTKATLLGQFQGSPLVEASLDAVVFEDGELVGADTTATFHYLDTFSSGIQAFAQEVAAMVDGPLESLAEHLQKISGEPAFEPKSASVTNTELDEVSFADRLAKANLRIAQSALAGSLLRTLQRGDIPLVRNQIQGYQSSELYSSVWRRP